MRALVGTAFLLLAIHGASAANSHAWIDLSQEWRFLPDPIRQGSVEHWESAKHPDASWNHVKAGLRWEDQGFPDVDGYCWYRVTFTLPTSWKKKSVWLVLGAVNDACVVYCNGRKVNSFGDERTRSMHATPVIAELTPYVNAGNENLLAIECLDWGGSGGLWVLPCGLTCEPERLPKDVLVNIHIDDAQGKLAAYVDLTPLGNDRPNVDIVASLRNVKAKSQEATEVKLPLSAGNNALSLTLHPKQARTGDRFVLTVTPRMFDGTSYANLALAANVAWPSQPTWQGKYKSLIVRNNFVTELYIGRASSGKTAFLNPRDGWVFFRLPNFFGLMDAPKTVVDEQTTISWRRNPDTQIPEAMLRVSKGKHALTIESGTNVEILAVPELMYCYYPGTHNIPEYGPFDWNYLKKNVLSHVNTIVSRGEIPATEFDEWRREGRAWIANAGLPGLSDKQPPSIESIYNEWAANVGATQPGFGGLIVDEFISASPNHYAAWGGAYKQLVTSDPFRGKSFYAWCGDLHRNGASLDFARTLQEHGDKFVWERYLREEPTQEIAQQWMANSVQQSLRHWKKSMPGVEQDLVVCLGYLCAPPESVNALPNVDYHVFMDMQFRLLATEPDFFGLYGIMEYMAQYADEESLRWAHKLIRHYCIEGKRTPLTNDPYILTHIDNPDFAKGLDGWTVEPAEDGGITTGHMDGFGFLEGRYPRTTDGDAYCAMTRSSTKANGVRQTIRDLKPGRQYSIKLLSANIDSLDQRNATGLFIGVTNAEQIPNLTLHAVYPSCYSHEVGEYNDKHRAYFTMDRLVFVPHSASAELTISDRPSETSAGQKTAFNFVEVQPFR